MLKVVDLYSLNIGAIIKLDSSNTERLGGYWLKTADHAWKYMHDNSETGRFRFYKTDQELEDLFDDSEVEIKFRGYI